MGVRVVIPNMSKTFGALHYAGEGEAVTWNICGEDVKGNFYTFFADALRGEVVEALVVGANGSQPFEFGEAVILENPSIIARNHETRSDGMNSLLLMADGILFWLHDESEASKKKAVQLHTYNLINNSDVICSYPAGFKLPINDR